MLADQRVLNELLVVVEELAKGDELTVGAYEAPVGIAQIAITNARANRAEGARQRSPQRGFAF